MMLIFCMAVLAFIGGIAVQFDGDHSNNDAGLVLAGAGALGAALTGWAMWGVLLPRDIAAIAKMAFFVLLACGVAFALFRSGCILSGVSLIVGVLALGSLA